MTENEFDKTIGEKLKSFERTPSMHIFNKVLETRQKNKKALFWNKLFNSNMFWTTLAILLLSTWSFISYNPNLQIKKTFAANNSNINHKVNPFSNEKLAIDKTVNKETSKHSRLKENVALNENITHSIDTKEFTNPLSLKSNHTKNLSNANSLSKEIDKTPASIASWIGNDDKEESSTEKYEKISLLHDLEFRKMSEVFNRNKGLVLNFFEKKTTDFPNPKIKNPTDRRLREIEIVGGIGTWLQTLDGIMLQGFEETNKVQTNLQVRTRFELTSNWNILAGIGFWNRNADYTINQSWEDTYIEIDTVKGFIIDPISGPKEITKYDTSSITQTINRNEQGRNTYLLMSVPIALEYQKQLGRGKVYVHSGVMFNLHQKDNATWNAEPNDNLQRYSGNSKQYSKSFHLSYFTGLGYTYVISPKISWSNEIQGFLIQTQNNPIGKLEGSKIYTLGLQTGIRIRL